MPNDNAGSEAGGLDRRQAQRHEVERPCKVVLESKPDGEAAGVTSNISRSGVLVRFPGVDLAGAMPNVGDEARVVIDLPRNTRFAPRVLECYTRVVRASGPPSDAPALAFEVIRMQIRDSEDAEDGAGERPSAVQ
jgi:hypothetical protein